MTFLGPKYQKASSSGDFCLSKSEQFWTDKLRDTTRININELYWATIKDATHYLLNALSICEEASKGNCTTSYYFMPNDQIHKLIFFYQTNVYTLDWGNLLTNVYTTVMLFNFELVQSMADFSV